MPTPDLDIEASHSKADSLYRHRGEVQRSRFEAALDRQFPAVQDKANPFWNTACRAYLRTEFNRLSQRKRTALIHQIEAGQIDPDGLDYSRTPDLELNPEERRMTATIRAVIASPPGRIAVNQSDEPAHPQSTNRNPRNLKS